MQNREFDTRPKIKPGLSGQVVERQKDEHEAGGVRLPQSDPFEPLIRGIGDASNAGVHASMLNQATNGRPSRAGQSLLRLQRQYGNRYVQRVLALAGKGIGEAEAAPEVEQSIQQARGGGHGIDSRVRGQMESAFGADFGNVRLHTDTRADTLNRELNARAFTTGQDIFFRQDAYNPGNSSGRELIAHELTHVVQQNGDKVQRKLTLGQPGDKYEQEADQVARAVMQQEQRAVQRESGEGLVRRQIEEEEEEVQMKPEASLVQRQVEEEEEEEPIQPKSEDVLVQRQADEGDNEDFEREKQEIAVGVQAKHEISQVPFTLKTFSSAIPIGAKVSMMADAVRRNIAERQTGVDGHGVLMRARARQGAKGPLAEEQVQSALVWYARQGASYTAEVIRQVQEEMGTKPDGIIGPFTVQAIAKWQSDHGLGVDGKAGSSTLKEMFGRDIRLGGAPKMEEVPSREEEGRGLMEIIRNLFRSLGFSDEQSAEALSGKEPTTAPEPITKKTEAKPKKSEYQLIYGKNFASLLDGVSLRASLFDKMKRMGAFALDNDLVTGNIVLSSGMRSSKKAHRWSTAYQIRQGNVPLKKLASLPDGKDMDGNIWYQPGWAIKKAKANALKVWDGALAAEGYPKGDKRREPNTFGGGVTCHATGKAIDATFLWNWNKGEGQKKAKEEKVSKLKATIEKRWAKRPKKKAKVLVAIGKFIGRGSYSEVAYKTVEDSGLTRPMLHATGSPEDWHYEEK